MKAKVNRVSIQIAEGDLLSLKVAVVVNATSTDLSLNPELLAKAGADVQRECARIGYCDVGSAVITGSGNLNSSGVEKIIHAVGPRWGEGSERGKLMNTILSCLQLAEENKLKSIVLPAISTGALGYPVENCAKTMITQIIDFTFEELKHLRGVIICLTEPLSFSIFKREFAQQLEELKGEDDVKVQV
jgi:O-acetyl-ADP-ribose deacetylase (regulator of RNase III)